MPQGDAWGCVFWICIVWQDFHLDTQSYQHNLHCCLTGGSGLLSLSASPHLVLLSFRLRLQQNSFSPPELNVGRFQAELNKMSVFILRAAASGFTAKGEEGLWHGKSHPFLPGDRFSLRLWSAICPSVSCSQRDAWLRVQRWSNKTRIEANMELSRNVILILIPAGNIFLVLFHEQVRSQGQLPNSEERS